MKRIATLAVLIISLPFGVAFRCACAVIDEAEETYLDWRYEFDDCRRS